MTLPHRATFRSRIVIAAAAAVGISVALASAASFVVVRGQLLDEVDSQLHRQADLVEARRIRTEIPNLQRLTGALQRSGLNSLVAFQIIRTDGSVITRDTAAGLPVTGADKAVAGGRRDEASRTIGHSGAGNHARVLTVGVGGGTAVQLARSLDDVDRTLRHLALVLLLVAAAGIVLALVLGYLVAKASLRPVERLTKAVERVGATRQLDETIEVTGDDELSRLAISFNTMLAALDESRRQQSQLVADAGHELRTPLTSLRTNIEVLMRVHELPEADRRALMADVTAQLGELTSLVGDLVELATEDEQRPESEEVRLDLIVGQAIERARRRAASLAFETSLQPALVRAQSVLLERAVLNVLDNAAKWSPPGSTVDVALSRDGGAWVLDVRDHGPGIATEDLPHVFDRFYRSAGARSLPGSGLGLAIVRQVVESNGGAVEAVAPPAGGTVVRFHLPAAEATGGGEVAGGRSASHGPAGPSGSPGRAADNGPASDPVREGVPQAQ